MGASSLRKQLSKRPFDVGQAMTRIEEAVRPFPKAAMFELADEGFASPFELLVACIISIRTLDETTLVCARRLFGLARTPEAMSRLPVETIDEAIGVSTFHEPKARQIREIARRIVAEHGGKLPCRDDVLLSFSGVGPKCANLVLGIGCDQARIGVDGDDQPPARRFRQARLHGQAPALLDLPGARHVPSGGGWGSIADRISSQMETRIRAATPADAPTLARLRYRFRIELGEPIETEEVFAGRCASWMADRLEANRQWKCWIAEQPSGIVGNLWLQVMEKLPNPVSEPEHHAYITNVYILPDCRNEGIGALLMDAALEWCRNSDIDAVFLWPSDRSRSFYQRYGFSVRDDLFALRPVQAE